MKLKLLSYLLLLFAVLFTGKSTYAQEIVVPQEYILYGGDTLNGFDFKTALDDPEAKSLGKQELLVYLFQQEKAFIKEKYNLPFEPPAASYFPDNIRGTLAAACNNADFEDGNYTNWTGFVGENNNSAAALTQTVAGINTLGINSAETTCSWHTLVTTGTDPFGGFAMLDPGGGAYACRLGGQEANVSSKTNGYYCGTNKYAPTGVSMGEVLEQSYAVTAANSMFSYNYAVVLNDGGHGAGQEPYFDAQVYDQNNNLITCLSYTVECTAGKPPAGFSTSGKTSPIDGSKVYYKGWTNATFNLKPYIGTNVTIVFTAAGCTLGGHFGYAYIDCSCSQVYPTVVLACNDAVITGPPGGTAYSWTGPGVVSGGTTQAVTVNASGTYSVVVTTSPGCTYTLDTAIVIPPPLVVNTTSSPAICTSKNGSATVTSVTGGTSPYTYSWAPGGATTTAIANLAAGSYTVTVKDANGCTKTATVTVTNTNTTLTPTVTQVNELCSGAKTGSATVTGVPNGTAAFIYSWTNGQTTSTASPLAAGSYTVTVTDANGCKGTKPVTITQPTPITTTTTSVASDCAANDGSASVTPSGGTPGYTYLWSNGQTASNITGVGPATYTVTVTDANSCTDKVTVIVPSTGATITPTASSVNLVCNGGDTGIVYLTGVTGTGTPPYGYLWSNGQTSDTASGLTAGTYTVTVTDANGCTGNTTATITQPPPIIPVLTDTNPLCFGGNGTITTAGTSGGTPGYTYLWNNNATSSSISAVAGTYTVIITDAAGCPDTVSSSISQPPQLIISASSLPASCNGGCDGQLSSTPSGGTPPYSYAWSTAATTSNVINVCSGTYSIVVTDSNKCTVDSTGIIVNESSTITGTATPTSAFCGLANGSACIAAGGGTPGYTYLWSNGATTTCINDIVPDTYTVTITDSKSCTDIVTVTVPNANGDTATITATTNVTCYGDSNGTATGLATGGSGPYLYSWNSKPVQTTPVAVGLPAGSYTLLVTDAGGCQDTAVAVITQPTQLRDSIISVTNEPCFGNSLGSATVAAKGGTGTYTYSWAPVGGTNSTASNLPAGSYTVTVTDANGCPDSAIAVINQPPLLTLTASAAAASCFGECNGQLLSIPAGGTPPYSYLWSNGATSISQLNICAGTYSLVVTDANGCTVDSTGIIVTQPTQVKGTTTYDSAFCFLPDGGACVTGGGGTPGYTYSWSNGMTATCINNVVAATYTVIVTDANKCNDTVTVIVPNGPGDVASIAATTNDTCFGNADGTATAIGTGGLPGYTYSWAPSAQVTPMATGLAAGNYTVTVTDKHGCTSKAIATINQPALVVATPGPPQTICIGQNATLSVSAVGGTPGYSYTWMPGNLNGPSVSVSPITTTTYTITTIDAYKCVGAPVMITVTVNPPLKITISPNLAACPGQSMSFTATVKGGDGIYSYSWVPPAGLNDTNTATVIATPGSTTEYIVTVHDACGDVPVIDSVKAIVDPLPVVNFTADTLNGCTPLCIKFNDTSTIAAGASIATWNWSFGDGGGSMAKDTTYCYQNAGVYTVGLVVVSDSGCPDSLIIPNMITAYSHPVAKFTASPQSTTIISPTIDFKDESTDAYGIKSWFWEFNDQTDSTSKLENPQHTFIDTGTYCPMLVVTNIHNCTDSVQNCVEIAPYFTLYIPNAFSPNGDGVNDVFTAKGTYVCSFDMYIFDRWGMELYYTNDINMGWDGTVQGGINMAQEDTYVYLIEAVDCVEHKKHRYVGRVSIVK